LEITALDQYWQAGRLRHSEARRDAQAQMASFMVRAASERAPFGSLSGGNQQKVVLARCLRRQPEVLLLDEPTQGVDIGARLEIWGLVRRAVQEGAAALVVSSDFEELADLCDRVLVLRGGRIAAEVAGAELAPDRLHELSLIEEAVA
jgi:ribose transport system ATP-binding protein